MTKRRLLQETTQIRSAHGASGERLDETEHVSNLMLSRSIYIYHDWHIRVPIRIARHLQSDTYAAVKIVPFSRFSRSPYLEVSSDTLSDLEHELAMMKLICHPNILALYDVWESQRET